MHSFREEQRFAPWVYLLLIVTALAGLAGPPFAMALAGDASALTPVLLVELFVGALMALPLNLLFVVTEVAEQEVVVSFGRWFTLYRKRVALHDISEARPVYYRPIRDAGGWGIRWGRFEGKRCAFLNARGDRGVLLVYGTEKHLVIGSQEPEQLAHAIRKAAGMSR